MHDLIFRVPRDKLQEPYLHQGKQLLFQAACWHLLRNLDEALDGSLTDDGFLNAAKILQGGQEYLRVL